MISSMRLSATHDSSKESYVEDAEQVTDSDGSNDQGDYSYENEEFNEDEDATEVEDMQMEGDLASEAVSAAASETAAAPDPKQQAISNYERKLAQEVDSLERKLRTERLALSKLKDKISESGKNGYFIVQAQVNEFQKRRDQDQKNRVTRNKREFVEKMLPVLDEFRKAPFINPPETEREQTIHKGFASLLDSLLAVFEKYGYKEYEPEVGDKLDARLHQIVDVVEQEEAGIILEIVRKGLKHEDGTIVRPSQVIASKAPTPPPPAASAVAEMAILDDAAEESEEGEEEDEEQQRVVAGEQDIGSEEDYEQIGDEYVAEA